MIGYLNNLTQADSVRFDAAFRRDLSEMGYVEGQVATSIEGLEWEAGCAIDYAIGSIEQAKYAILDAIVGRVEFEEAKRR